MLVDLVQTTTRDGLRLDGAYLAPPAGSSPALGVDGFCLVHGTGGSFYSSTLFDGVAERLLQLGCAVLRVNTRGHDGISTAATAAGGRRLGAASEIVDDCRHDLAAWLDWLRERAGPRVGLVGHSLGAVKCLYALAQEPALGACCVVAISPPRLSHSWFLAGPEAALFRETWELAQRHVQTGQPRMLLEVKLPLPFVITAEGYVEKYGPDERYNYLHFVQRVGCPVLVTLGGLEVAGNMAFRDAPQALTELRRQHGRPAVETISGADHFYSTGRPELLARMEAWLRSECPLAQAAR
jgi:pimeloyl-ACP methyl ester carboxylesterase